MNTCKQSIGDDLNTWHDAYIRDALAGKWVAAEHTAYLTGRGYVPSSVVQSIAELTPYIIASAPVNNRRIIAPANITADDIVWSEFSGTDTVTAVVIADSAGQIALSLSGLRGLEFTPDGRTVLMRIDGVLGLGGL